MLSFFRRKKVMKRVLWVLAVIIILAFVLWGAPNLSNQESGPKYIGIINGKKVSTEQFVKNLKEVQIGFFLNYFNQPEILNKLQGDRALLNRIAWENIILSESAAKDGLTAGNEEVVSFIKKHPLFVRGGIFDEKLYNYILKNNLGMTPRAFEESVRSFLVNAKYKSNIIKNITVTDDEALEAYKSDFEKVKMNYVVIDKKNFLGDVTVTDAEIDTFYNQNKTRFVDPERIILEYIAFPHPKEGVKEKAFSDLKTSYEKLKRRPKNMKKVAESLNLEVKETNAFSQDEIVPEINDIQGIAGIAFRMKPIQDILPLANQKEIGTSYIIRVKEILPSREKTKKEITPYIVGTLKDEKSLAIAEARAREAYEKVKKENLSLKDIAKQMNLKLQKTEFISRFDYIEDVGESYELVNIAIDIGVGEISKPLKTRKGFALLEPIEIQFVKEETFQTEKEGYQSKVLSVKKMKALEDWFNSAKAGTSLEIDLDRL